MELAVSPRDCVLLLSVPTTRDAFLRDLDAPDKDFAASIRGRWRHLRADAVWELTYLPLVQLVGNVSRVAARLGVTVVTDGTARDFRAALAQYSVVTLVTHQRRCDLVDGDVCRPDEMLAAIHGGATVLTAWLRDRMSSPRPAGVRDLMRWLNELLISESETLHRALLELEFPSFLRARPALEFFDRLHTVAEVVDAVPDGWSDVLDLSVCESSVLGEAIRRRTRDGLIIVNRRPASLLVRLLKYRRIMERLSSRGPRRYTEVATEVTREIMEAIR